MFDIRGVRSIYYVLYVQYTWCLLSIYVVNRKRVGKVCHSCLIIFCTENEVYAEKHICDTYAHLLINVNITIGKSNIYIRYSMFVDKRSSHKKCINIHHMMNIYHVYLTHTSVYTEHT